MTAVERVAKHVELIIAVAEAYPDDHFTLHARKCKVFRKKHRCTCAPVIVQPRGRA